jgi:hypothetical protein
MTLKHMAIIQISESVILSSDGECAEHGGGDGWERWDARDGESTIKCTYCEGLCGGGSPTTNADMVREWHARRGRQQDVPRAACAH